MFSFGGKGQEENERGKDWTCPPGYSPDLNSCPRVRVFLLLLARGPHPPQPLRNHFSPNRPRETIGPPGRITCAYLINACAYRAAIDMPAGLSLIRPVAGWRWRRRRRGNKKRKKRVLPAPTRCSNASKIARPSLSLSLYLSTSAFLLSTLAFSLLLVAALPNPRFPSKSARHRWSEARGAGVHEVSEELRGAFRASIRKRGREIRFRRSLDLRRGREGARLFGFGWLVGCCCFFVFFFGFGRWRNVVAEQGIGVPHTSIPGGREVQGVRAQVSPRPCLVSSVSSFVPLG